MGNKGRKRDALGIKRGDKEQVVKIRRLRRGGHFFPRGRHTGVRQTVEERCDVKMTLDNI